MNLDLEIGNWFGNLLWPATILFPGFVLFSENIKIRTMLPEESPPDALLSVLCRQESDVGSWCPGLR